MSNHQIEHCLHILENITQPATAIELAERLGLIASRESNRRQIRLAIQILRQQGYWIIATLKDGYWLTHEEQLWRDYLAGRKIDALKILAEGHRRKRQLQEQKQPLLFAVNRQV